MQSSDGIDRSNTVAEDLEILIGTVNADPMLQFFRYTHLPPHLGEVSAKFAKLALDIVGLPRNPERTVALRKLLEAKDCAVRSILYK